jgi:hypothetical protein
MLALAALAAILAWIGGIGVINGAPGRAIVLGLALAPAVTLVLRFAKGRLGSVLAVPVAGVSAIVGALLSFCLCPAPLSTESVAILVAAALVSALAVIDVVIGMLLRGARAT